MMMRLDAYDGSVLKHMMTDSLHYPFWNCRTRGVLQDRC